MPRPTIPISTDLTVLIQKYRECRDQAANVPPSDRRLRATLDAHALAWSRALADEVVDASAPVAIEVADDDETAARMSAHRVEVPGVGAPAWAGK